MGGGTKPRIAGECHKQAGRTKGLNWIEIKNLILKSLAIKANN